MRDKRVVSYITLKEAVSIADIAHKQNVTISEIIRTSVRHFLTSELGGAEDDGEKNNHGGNRGW